jgi:photosystem II stability/assembly factor-like uncharacterized protein
MLKTKLLITFSLLFACANAQTTWYEIPTGVDTKLNTISFSSPSVGFIGGNDTLLLKTTDSGATWNQVSFSGVTVFPGGEHILDIQFINESLGYMIVGPYGGMYKTIDGGSNWTQVLASANLCFLETIYFFYDNNGFIGGSGCFEGELIDQCDGTSTSPASTSGNGNSSSDNITDFDFFTASYGLASSAAGRMYRTTDGGQNWDSIHVNVGPGLEITSVEIINDSVAYAGASLPGGHSGVLKTIDSGLNWIIDNYTPFPVLSMNFHDVHLGANGTLYAPCTMTSTSGYRIFENTVPGFASPPSGYWQHAIVDHPIYDMVSQADTIVWGVGDSGLVVVNVPPSWLSVSETMAEEDFEVYPNPFESTINLDLNGYVNPTLMILDAQGRIVEQKVISTSQQDLSFLEKGIYVFVLTDGESKSITRVVKR